MQEIFFFYDHRLRAKGNTIGAMMHVLVLLQGKAYLEIKGIEMLLWIENEGKFIIEGIFIISLILNVVNKTEPAHCVKPGSDEKLLLNLKFNINI